jgi:hypothetical protein
MRRSISFEDSACLLKTSDCHPSVPSSSAGRTSSYTQHSSPSSFMARKAAGPDPASNVATATFVIYDFFGQNSAAYHTTSLPILEDGRPRLCENPIVLPGLTHSRVCDPTCFHERLPFRDETHVLAVASCIMPWPEENWLVPT